MVCDEFGEDVLISDKLYRMGQDEYFADYATDRLSHFQPDICGLSALCAATLYSSSVTHADSVQVGIVIIRSKLSTSL
jgi:hypothetical protein